MTVLAIITPLDFCNDTPVSHYLNQDRVLAVNTKIFDEYSKRLNECITQNHIDSDDRNNFIISKD